MNRADAQVEREDGNVYLHGPTSAFRHLGKHPRGQANGLNIYPVPTSRGPPQFGHSRFLPAVVQLSKDEHDQCLDRFFGYYACWGESLDCMLKAVVDDRYAVERLAIQTRHGSRIISPIPQDTSLLSHVA
jgi:hypothetical protein